MRKLFTLVSLVVAVVAVSAQTAVLSKTSAWPTTHRVCQLAPGSAHPAAIIPDAARGVRSLVCDSDIAMDYSAYAQVLAANTGLNFNGNWYGTNTTGYFASAITSFVNQNSVDSNYLYYAGVIFDTLAFGNVTAGTTATLALDSTTIYLDSLGMFEGLWGDSTLMASDSLIFRIWTITGGTLSASPAKTLIYRTFSQLRQFYLPTGYLQYYQIPVHLQLTEGQGFLVAVYYNNKNQSSTFGLSYTYADSCGTVDYMGSPVSSPAYIPPFAGNDIFGAIEDTSTFVQVGSQDNTYGYFGLGFPDDCSFVYTQNWELIPIMTLCQSSTVVTSPCTPNPGVTSGLQPGPSQVPCVVQGTSFSETYSFVVPASITLSTLTLTVDSITFTDIANLPSGLTWAASLNPATYPGGSNGCFIVTGTTNAPCGEYKTPMYATIYTNFGAFSGNFDSIASAYGITGYPEEYLQVIAPGGTCPTVDTTQTASFVANPGCGISVNISVTISKTDVLCHGSATGTATANASGGTGYTYHWNNGATTQEIFNLTAGTYSVTVTSGTSTASASVTIDQPSTAVTASASSTSTSCTASTGTITASASGGTAGYSYLWNTGATSANVGGLGAGTYIVTVHDANQCSATASTTITEPGASFTLSVTETNITCYGASTGSATATVSGGTGITFTWSNGATTAGITGVTAGTYTVTATDLSGCEKTATATITQPGTPLTANVTTTSTTCGATTGSATVTVGGSTGSPTYLWSTSATTSSISNLGVGVYNVTVTSGACSATGSGAVNASNGPSVSLSKTDPTCFGSTNGLANASASGGTGTLTYLWNTGATTASINNLGSGTYSVTVSDGTGCQAVGSIILTAPNPIVINPTVQNVTCHGAQNGSVTLSVSGGTSPYSYSWTGGFSNYYIDNVSGGSYAVTVTDFKNCTASDVVTVNEPSAINISSTKTDVTCHGAQNGTINLNVTGGTSPYFYGWSISSTASSLSGLSGGTYDITITDHNGCTATDQITINEPSAINANATSTPDSCFGGQTGSATISATGGTSPYTFSWSNGSTTATVSGLGANSYTVTVTDFSTCTASASVTVSGPAMALTVTATSVNNVSCYGGSNGGATLSPTGGTPPYTYSWSTGSSAQTESGLTSGTYQATVHDNMRCSVTYSLTITEPSAVSVSITTTPSGGSNGTATATASGGSGSGYSYTWSTTATTASISGLAANTTVMVTVTDNNSCSATASATIGVSGINGLGANVPTVALFPNPASDNINVMIETTQPQSLRFVVTDMTGKLVYSSNESNNGKQNHIINVSGFAGGVYIIDIIAGEQSVRERFVVTR